MGRENFSGEPNAMTNSDQTIESRLKIITEENQNSVCIFCKTSIVSDLTFGPLYYHDGVVTHYFCMLFSAALSQNGADEDGILGFMPADIMKEVRRSFRLKCIYCNAGGASVGCCNKKCREVFHFPCGLKNGANFQFHGMYESYCARHFKRPHGTTKLKLKDWSCPICMSGAVKGQDPVIGTCCKAAVFHKECLQRMALSAGYFFKCPMCNSSKKFVQEMRHSGIYVPEQDASWEKDNAFQDLYMRYTKCDAVKCSCAKGREFEAHKGNWMLARCRLCGAAAIHRQCGKLETVSNWACEPCLLVETKADEEKKKKPKSRKAPSKSSRQQETGPSAAIVHVSAVSANRRVRNGSVKRPSQARREASTSFTLTKVKIDSSCFSYFPYTKEALKRKYSHATSLPDWRNMELQVNVCNWIPPLTKDISCLRKVPIPSSQTSAAGPSKQTGTGKKSGAYKRKPPLHRGDLKSILDAVKPVPVLSVKSVKRINKASTKLPISGSAKNVTPVKSPPISPVIKKVPPIVLTAISPVNSPAPPLDCFTTTGRFLPSKRFAYESALKEPSVVPEKRFKIRPVVQDEYKKKYNVSPLQMNKKKKHKCKSSWSRGVVKKNKTLKGLKLKSAITTEEPVEVVEPQQTDFPEEQAEGLKTISEISNESGVSETVLPVDTAIDSFAELSSEPTSVFDSEFNKSSEELEEFPKRQEPTPEEEKSFRALGNRLRTELSRGTPDSGMSIRRRKQNFSNSTVSTRVGEEPEIIKVVYAGKPPKVVSKKLEWRHEPGPLNSKNKDVGTKAKLTRSSEARSRSSAALAKAADPSQDQTACEAEKKLMDETENIYVSTSVSHKTQEVSTKEGLEKVGVGRVYSKTPGVFFKEQEFSIAAEKSSMTEDNTKSAIFNAGDTKTNLTCADSNVSSATSANETTNLDSAELQLGVISPMKSTQVSSGRFGRQINSTVNI